jgi:TusA-related sulfurtransferase
VPGHGPTARPQRIAVEYQCRGRKKKGEPVDLTSYGCPLHYIKARHALRGLADGEIVEFLFEAGETAGKAAASLESDGHRILSVEPAGSAVRVGVRKQVT